MAAADATGTEGVSLLRLDTPFLVGPINVWLIEDDPLTIVDSGPNTATGLLQLRALLAERGHGLGDVGRVLVTHQHLDHAGLAGPIAAVSGAEVVAFTGMDAYLAGGAGSYLAEDRWDRDTMRRLGVPDAKVDGWWAARPDASGFAAAAPEVRAIGDGDELVFAGRTLQVHHRPGHSPSDLVFHDRERGVLFAGDHLLDGHAPIAVLHAALPGAAPRGRPDPAGVRGFAGPHDPAPTAVVDGSTPGALRSGTARPAADPDVVRVSALLDLRESLRRTRTLDADVALTGHGDTVADVAANVDRRLAEQDAAAETLLAELRSGGPGTPHELAIRLAPNGRSHPFFGLCDTVGTLDLLVDDGAAEVEPGDGPPRYGAR